MFIITSIEYKNGQDIFINSRRKTMNKTFQTLLIFAMCLMLIPSFILLDEGVTKLFENSEKETLLSNDCKEVTILNNETKDIAVMDIKDYLIWNVIAQMPGTFEKEALKAKLDGILDGLAEAQFPNGFLWGAKPLDLKKPELQFDNVEEGKTDLFKEAWVPWYTMHKILAGLLSAYEVAGSEKALSIADRAYVLETGNITLEGDAKKMLQNEKVKKAYLGE